MGGVDHCIKSSLVFSLSATLAAVKSEGDTTHVVSKNMCVNQWVWWQTKEGLERKETQTERKRRDGKRELGNSLIHKYIAFVFAAAAAAAKDERKELD